MPATNVTPLRPRSITTDPLLLNTERLHRVDASQLPHGSGVNLGHCRTDMGLCHGHAGCADIACPGHPNEMCAPTPLSTAHPLDGKDGPLSTAHPLDGKDGPLDHAARANFWRCYLAAVAAVLLYLIYRAL